MAENLELTAADQCRQILNGIEAISATAEKAILLNSEFYRALTGLAALVECIADTLPPRTADTIRSNSLLADAYSALAKMAPWQP